MELTGTQMTAAQEIRYLLRKELILELNRTIAKIENLDPTIATTQDVKLNEVMKTLRRTISKTLKSFINQ